MHGIVKIAFGVPARNDHGLMTPLFIRRPGPDFKITFPGKLKRTMPGLPGIRIDRCLKLSSLPGRSIVDGDIDLDAPSLRHTRHAHPPQGARLSKFETGGLAL